MLTCQEALTTSKLLEKEISSYSSKGFENALKRHKKHKPLNITVVVNMEATQNDLITISFYSMPSPTTCEKLGSLAIHISEQSPPLVLDTVLNTSIRKARNFPPIATTTEPRNSHFKAPNLAQLTLPFQ